MTVIKEDMTKKCEMTNVKSSPFFNPHGFQLFQLLLEFFIWTS